jgi:hypothetical protein
MYKHLLFGSLLMLLLASCRKNEITDATQIGGRWIEATGRGDTLEFVDNSSLLTVKRGLVLQNGNRVPKIGSGLYLFKVLPNYKMEVQNTLSSSMNATTSHLELKDNILYVSNFYEAVPLFELRQFRKGL